MTQSNANHHGYNAGHLILALVAGAVTGAGIAYLTAPKSGADTRDRIRDIAHDASHTAHQLPEAIRRASEAAREAFVNSLELEREAEVIVAANPKHAAARRHTAHP